MTLVWSPDFASTPGKVILGGVPEPILNHNQKPSLDLKFAANKTLHDSLTGQNLITFSRPVGANQSPGTYVDVNGLIQTSSANTPRFDHNPDTLESLGLLIEESRENFVTYSNVDPLGWTPSGGSGNPPIVTWTGEADPSGGTDAATITFQNSVPNQQIVATVPSYVTGTVYTYSVYARVSSGTYDFLLFIFDGTSQSKAVTATTEWQRFDFVFTAASSSSISSVRIRSVSPAAGDELIVWGAQLEEGSFPTSLIPTSGTALTRSADDAEITGSSFSSWYNQPEGTILLEFSRLYTPAADEYWYSFSGSNTSTERHSVYQSTSSDVVHTTFNGAQQTDLSFPGSLSNKSAYVYSTNDYAACVDGGTVLVDATATVPTILKLNIGSLGNSTAQANGTIARFTYYPYRLENTALQTLTS